MINSNKLKAMAGWALSKLSGASDAQAVALHKFKDGCGALADNCPEETPVQARRAPAAVPVGNRPVNTLPPEVAGNQHCDQTGQHRFDIRTQHCVYCGESYRKAKGRKPELMR